MNFQKILILIFLAVTAMLHAKISPNALFSEHCVLQQGKAIPVWGKATPGEIVTIRFRGEKSQATTNEQGDWKTNITTGKPGGPFTLSIIGSDTSDSIQLHDVLVGEVWLASGQSNMERQLQASHGQRQIVNAPAEIAKADYPTFRQFHVPLKTAHEPLDTVDGSWIVCSPETAGKFTAVGFFFGRDLQSALKIPVGIINASWGGTPAEAWTSEQALAPFPEFTNIIAKNKTTTARESNEPLDILERNEDWFLKNDLGSKKANLWSTSDFDDASWPSMEIPNDWEPTLGDINGVVWFRKTLDLPSSCSGREAILSLGNIDDADTTWVNGVKVGATSGWNFIRRYTLPKGLLKPGQNTIAVRVLDTGSNGGFRDLGAELSIAWGNGANETAKLEGPWHYKIGLDLAELRTPHPFRIPRLQDNPGFLFNAMISPLIPYSIRGVIWYQGESNAHNPKQYQSLFPAMIADWRGRWGLGDFPFLYVQIAPYQGQPPEIREAQLLTLDSSPNTAMAVTIDVGEATDIHPTNKEPVGERLALAARALAYGEDIEYSGPLYKSMRIEKQQAVLEFTHLGKGLSIGGQLKLFGFTIFGEDGIFHEADAQIEGDTVVVSNPNVPQPVAVRYGWENVAAGNLFNKAGLPASPFRTDFE